MGWSIAAALAGAGWSIAGAAFGAGANRRAANRAENLFHEKRALQLKRKKSNLKEAQSNLEQGLANNILVQSLTGIELSSPTFAAVQDQAYRDNAKDVANINLQDEYDALGIQSEINSIDAQRKGKAQEYIGYLSAALNGAAAGASFQSSFGGKQESQVSPAQRRQSATWISGLNV